MTAYQEFSQTNKNPLTEFLLALRRPIQLRLKSRPPLELFLLLTLFILNLSAAFDTVNRQMLLIMRADPGSLRDCLPPVSPHLSDIIEGSSPRCTSLQQGSPLRARSGSTAPPSFSNLRRSALRWTRWVRWVTRARLLPPRRLRILVELGETDWCCSVCIHVISPNLSSSLFRF